MSGAVSLDDNGESWFKLFERAKQIREYKIAEIEIGVSRALSRIF